MGVDLWSVTGAVASVVAAVGVVWERWHWLRSRPRPDVRTKFLGPNALAGLGGDNGKYRGVIKNWGTEDALGIMIHGWHCTAHLRRGAATILKPQEEMPFTLDVDRGEFDRAWLTVAWHRPGSADSGWMAWFPVNDHGPLADVVAEQVDMSRLRRGVALWLIGGRMPTPMTRPSGKVTVGMPRSPKKARSMYGRSGPVARWRSALSFKLYDPPRAAVEAVAVDHPLDE